MGVSGTRIGVLILLCKASKVLIYHNPVAKTTDTMTPLFILIFLIY